MQLKSLRLFTLVVRTGSFGAAAGQANTVQSNVTAHIKKLERELEVQLFDRSGAVHPTPAGRMLLTHADRVLAAHDDAIARFRDGQAPSGQLRIGSMETTAAVRLPPILTAFHRAYPDVDLTLATAPSADLTTQLLNGEIDCAFVAGRLPHRGFHVEQAFTERLVLVSHEPLARLPAAQELLGATFLAFRQGCSYRQRIELLLARYGVSGGRIFEFGTLDAMLGCVAAGMGYALLPESVIATHRHRFDIHASRLPDPLCRIDTTIAAAPRAGWTPALTAFIESVRTGAAEEEPAPMTESAT